MKPVLPSSSEPSLSSSEPSSLIQTLPGLVAYWDFSEPAGSARESKNTAHRYPLLEVGGDIPRMEGGPLSGYSAIMDGKHYFRIPFAQLGKLDIHGKEAQVSMFAVIALSEMTAGVTIAGVWGEGKGAYDDSGTRQYALLLNMGAYGGARQVNPHISSEGGVSRRADGSGLPWCADYAANVTPLPLKQWITIGFTYDATWIRAYYNGVMEIRPSDAAKDNRADRYFTQEGPGGKPRGMNPYYHGRGIFRYAPAMHSITKPDGGSDFTVGACYAGGRSVGNPLVGAIAGLAVFDRALSDTEMFRLHEAARLDA